MATLVVVGAQWGDEGKGRITDLLSRKADMVVRFQGGANAGHTVVVDGQEFILHLVPSGVIQPHVLCVIGNGVVIDPATLLKEIADLRSRGLAVDKTLQISDRAHVTLPYHRLFDVASEQGAGARKIGTTQRGIGPTYMDKVARMGLRVADLFHEDLLKEKIAANLADKKHRLAELAEDQCPDAQQVFDQCRSFAEQIANYVTDTSVLVNEAIDRGQNVLFEGAQGAGLDVDFGTFPYVTSSNTTAGGACTGTGVGPTRIDRVIGVAKAYVTRVGEGPFPSRMEPDLEQQVRERGHEYGATTGRPRNCGWFDGVLARHSSRINGLDGLVITKLDVLDPLKKVLLCTGYEAAGGKTDQFPASLCELRECHPVYEEMEGWQEDTSAARRWTDLPAQARKYLDRLAEISGVPIAIVSVGRSRQEAIVLDTSLMEYNFGRSPQG